MPFVITAPRRKTRRRSNKPKKSTAPARRSTRRSAAPKIIVIRAGSNAPRRRRRRNLPVGLVFKKLSPQYGPGPRPKKGRGVGRFQSGWQSHAKWGKGLAKRRGGSWKGNPPKSRRRRRRSNPLGFRRTRRRRGWRRMNSPRKAFKRRYRRNPPGGFLRPIRELFSFGTWGQAALGLAGMSIALSAPKMLAQYVHPSLGRGLGGVLTSGVSTAVVSGIVSLVNVRMGKALFAGGLIGTAAMALASFLPKFREQVLPFEEALVAASLPTVAPGNRDALPASLMARMGQGGLGKTVEQVKANEAAYRRALGLRDYVQEKPAGRAGVRDYVNYGASTRKTAGAFRGPEQF